jgi:hypothetical protein
MRITNKIYLFLTVMKILKKYSSSIGESLKWKAYCATMKDVDEIAIVDKFIDFLNISLNKLCCPIFVLESISYFGFQGRLKYSNKQLFRLLLRK